MNYFTLTNSMTGSTPLDIKTAEGVSSTLEIVAGQLKDLITDSEQNTGLTVTITVTDGAITVADA